MKEHVYQQEKTLEREGLFFKLDKEPLFSNCPLHTLILIYINQRQGIVYANKKFRTVLGTQYPYFINQGIEHWFSLIPNQFKTCVRQQISEFTQASNRNDLKLSYPVLGNNGQLVHLTHKMYRCKFHNLEFMVNLMSLHPKKMETDYFFSPKPISISEDDNRQTCISKREEEVLHLIANGYSSKEIAEKLYISNHTVISHRKNLMEKFKVKNTAHLIKMAYQYIHLT